MVFGSKLTAKVGGLSSATAKQVKNLWQSFSCGACELEILFVSPDVHRKGVGTAAWREVERLYPDTVVWETCTPYFEKRNNHFYINKCGFSAVEFFCEFHRDPLENERFGPQENDYPEDDEGPDEMFRFVKYMK